MRFGFDRVRLDQGLHPTGCRSLPAFDPRHAGRHVHRQEIAFDDVLSLRDDDITNQRNGIGLHVEDAIVAGGGLILLYHDHVALGFDTTDLLSSNWAANRP